MIARCSLSLSQAHYTCLYLSELSVLTTICKKESIASLDYEFFFNA